MQGFRGARASVVVAAAIAVAVGSSSTAQAQSFPNKPIRLIVSFPPGGSADVVARGMQPHMERVLGQPIVIENRPGAGGAIGVDAVAKAPPDGYMIGLGAAGALAINVSLKQQMPYDPLTALAPVTMLAHIPFLLIAPANSTTGTVADVVKLAKSKPDALSIGHGGNGTAMHLTAQLLNHMGGVNIPMVPYRGSVPVAQDVLAGHVPLGVADITSSIQLVQSGQIKAVAVSTAKRVPSVQQVPTFAESGLPGYESVGWFGLVAPAGTPPEIIAKLNAAIVGALNDPALQNQIRTVGAEPAPGTPAEFAGYIRSEIAKWAKVVEGTGAR